MFEQQDNQYIKGALSAMMFITEEPVTVLTFAGMLGVSVEAVQDALLELQEEYRQQDSGIQLYEVAGGWRLATHPKYHELIERYVVSWDKRKLSQAALEVLAIIAYCQPVTRSAISSIRGVNSDSSVNSLLEKGYVREAGFLDAPGNPAVYGTTKAFLERFGLRSVEDLPDLESFAPDQETQNLIFDRLNIVRDNHAQIQLNNDNTLFGENNNQADTLDTQANMLVSQPDEGNDSPNNLTEVMQQMLDEALKSSIGVVEKIDFDELVFDEDE